MARLVEAPRGTADGFPKMETFANFDDGAHAKDIALSDAGRVATAVRASKGGGWLAFVRGPPLTTGVHTVHFTVTSGSHVGVGVAIKPQAPGAYTDAPGTWVQWLNGGGTFADGALAVADAIGRSVNQIEMTDTTCVCLPVCCPGKEVESAVWKRRPSATVGEGDEFSVTMDANAGEVWHPSPQGQGADCILLEVSFLCFPLQVLVSIRGSPEVVIFRGLAGLPLHIVVCVVGLHTAVRVRRAWSRLS
jgi:hypothetical protein